MASQSLPNEQWPWQSDDAEEFHISQWLEVIQRRRRLIVLVVLVFLAIQILRYIVSPPEYSATAILQIERRQMGVVSMEAAYSAASWVDAESFYPTQYFLLQSRGLAERVVRTLHLAEDPQFNPSRATIVGSSPARPTAGDDAAAVARYASRLRAGLTVNPIRNTRLVEVSFRARNAELAARIANGVVENFIDWSAETHYLSVGKTSSFLATQIENLKQEIQEKEAQLQSYSRREDIVGGIDASTSPVLQGLEALNRDYVAAMSERIQKESRYKELSSGSADFLAESALGGLVNQQRTELARLERDYANKLSTYKPDWPAMQELKAQIDKGRLSLTSLIQETVTKARENARTEYQTAQRREQSLAEEMERQKAGAMKLNSASVEYSNLKVEVSTRRSLYNELLRKQSETEIASHTGGGRDSNVAIVDRALVPGGPFRPSLTKNVFLGLVLGLGFGIGLVFLIEYLDRTIKSPEDVERILGLPLLALVPDISSPQGRHGSRYYGYYGMGKGSRRKTKRKSLAIQAGQDRAEVPIELIPHTHPRLVVSEAYRTARTALLLSSAAGLRTVSVTSAIPSEGKTSTSINLAVVLSQLGGDVLYVGSDLRKSRSHEIFGLSNRIGLVSYLTGAVDFNDVILPTSIPHLFATPAGPAPPNPSELLSSRRMQDFVELARQRFQFVVLDAPPLMAVTDAAIIGSMVDGVVICLGAGMVLREDAVASRDRLIQGNVKILGVVLNRFLPQTKRYGRRYHYYEHEYGGQHLESPARPVTKQGARPK